MVAGGVEVATPERNSVHVKAPGASTPVVAGLIPGALGYWCSVPKQLDGRGDKPADDVVVIRCDRNPGLKSPAYRLFGISEADASTQCCSRRRWPLPTLRRGCADRSAARTMAC